MKINRRWRFRRLGTIGVMSAAIAILLPTPSTTAIELGDGTTAFTNPPRLESFTTTDKTAGQRNATYYVTVTLLPEAGAALKTLEITLTEGRFTRLDYRTDAIEVFAGGRHDRQEEYAVEAATYDEDSQTLSIHLQQAALPGQDLTFALELVRNPRFEGVYLFEVTAVPVGALPRSQRIGTGRIHIYPRRIFQTY